MGEDSGAKADLIVAAQPNKRLKLAGADRSKGSGVLCAGAHELSFNDRCAGGRAAPQLKRGPLGGASLPTHIRGQRTTP